MNKPKIVFLHGFFASGSCVPANALHEVLDRKMTVLTPDLPIHPHEALRMIRELCNAEKPDILVGNSCGSFYAQMISNELGIPALLGNPFFMMTEFLKPRIGQHEYKSPRRDGRQEFVIDEQLISEFDEIERVQFDGIKADNVNNIWGLFGEKDTLAHFEPMFREHYPTVHHFPGGHTPTAQEVKEWYVPLIEKISLTPTLSMVFSPPSVPPFPGGQKPTGEGDIQISNNQQEGINNTNYT